MPRIDDKQNSDEPTFEMYKSEVQGYSAEEEVCEKIEEQALDQSIILSKESMHQLILELKVVLSKSFCQFVDPSADYMESSFLTIFLVISHEVFLVYGCKYESHLQIMLHAFQRFLVFSSEYEDMLENQLLENFFWKFVYT